MQSVARAFGRGRRRHMRPFSALKCGETQKSDRRALISAFLCRYYAKYGLHAFLRSRGASFYYFLPAYSFVAKF